MRLRYLLIGIGILVALVAVALTVFVVTFDANRYKSTLIDLVESRFHRKLTIEGDLSLAVLPRIALSVGNAQLSGPNGEGAFAQIDSARIGVAPWPLLSRRVQIERISLDGLKVEAVRHRDGSTNFDDLLANAGSNAGTPTEPASNPPASPTDAASAAAATVSIAQLQLRDAAFVWRDEANDSEWRLQKLGLDADRIESARPGKLQMTGRLIGKQPAIAADVKLSSGYRADFASGRIEISDLKLDAQTPDGIRALLEAPALTIDDQAVEGRPIRAQIEVQRDTLNVDAQLSIAAPSRSKERFVFPEIRAEVDASGAELPADGVKIALAGDGALDAERQTATLSLRGTLDGSPTQARASATRFSPLALQYELQTDRIDLDRYRDRSASPGARGAPAASSGTAGAPPTTGATGEAGGAGPAGASTGADAAIPVPPIVDVDTSGSIRIGLLQVSGIGARDIAATIRSGQGRIDLTRLAAGVYRGSLTGSGTLGANGRHSLKMNMQGIDVGMALRDLARRDVLDGRGDVAIDIDANGTTIPALERSLAGTARLALRDGAILGIDLDKVIRQVGGALAAVRGGASAIEQNAASSEKTAFSSLDASFAIRNGVARNDDLDLRSPLLRVGGSGQIDIPAGAIDYLLRVSLVGTLAGQGGADLSALRGLTIPVRVSGPFAALGYRIDMESLARGTVKKELQRQLQERLLGKPESGGSDAQKPSKSDKAKELLRGLLGG